jgi:tetratricopeptide (TPR) repeat protein
MTGSDRKAACSAVALAAMLACSAIIAGEPGDDAIEAQLEKAATAESQNRFDDARKLYESAVKKHPESALAWSAYGEHLRFYVHDAKAAEAAFRKALNARSQTEYAEAFSWRGLGEIAEGKGDFREAIRCFENSLKAMPLADTCRSLCHLYCAEKDFESAGKYAAQAVKLNPDDAIARLLHAAQLERAGERHEGRKQFQKGLLLAGVDTHGNGRKNVHCCVFYNAAGYLSVAGNKAAALRMLRKFFETPNHRHLAREQIESDADFSELRKTAEFRALLDEFLPANNSK